MVVTLVNMIVELFVGYQVTMSTQVGVYFVSLASDVLSSLLIAAFFIMASIRKTSSIRTNVCAQ